jgi:hypothetical protein
VKKVEKKADKAEKVRAAAGSFSYLFQTLPHAYIM